MTCFQSVEQTHCKLPIFIVPSKLNFREMSLFGDISEKLLQEELDEYDEDSGIAKDTSSSVRIAQIQDGIHLPLLNFFLK